MADKFNLIKNYTNVDMKLAKRADALVAQITSELKEKSPRYGAEKEKTRILRSDFSDATFLVNFNCAKSVSEVNPIGCSIDYIINIEVDGSELVGSLSVPPKPSYIGTDEYHSELEEISNFCSIEKLAFEDEKKVFDDSLVNGRDISSCYYDLRIAI